MSPDEYKTLTLLEVTGDAPVTAVARRSMALLTYLRDQGFVTVYDGVDPVNGGTRVMMSITDAGRRALAEHRTAQEGTALTTRTAEPAEVVEVTLSYVEDGEEIDFVRKITRRGLAELLMVMEEHETDD
ncbi:hypothetical protein [Streptomyces eurythermus]